MKVLELPIELLREAKWNPNRMDEAMLMHLRESIRRFGMVGVLVVRHMSDDTYEVISGNQRLSVLREMGFMEAPCIIIQVDDAHARLLAQALNRIEGSDDLGLKAELVKEVLKTMPQAEVLSLLPESAESLQSLASLGEIDMASHLQAWQQAQAARLRHLTLQLTTSQLELVEEAFERMLPRAKKLQGDSPNTRGTALYLICQAFLKQHDME